MKLIVLLLSLVLMCLALKSVKGIQPPLDDALLRNSSVMAFGTDADIDGETGLVIAQSSLNTFELIMKGVEFFTKNKLVTTITSFLGPLGSILGIVGDIMGIFNKGPDIEKLFAEQTAFINESFIAMSNQLDRLSEQMSTSEDRIIATIQYQAVFEKIAQIDACLEMIPTILRSFPNNTIRLLENIDDQLRIYGNLDTDLTNLVFVQSPATSQQNSLIDSIASLCTPESQSCKIASSTNQVIFEFYKHIMVYIAKGKEFQTMAYQIKEILTEVDRSDDIQFVNNKVEGNMQKIMTSLNMTMTRYKDPKHLKSHLKLIRSPSEGSNYVRLQRVMYNAIFWEDQLSSTLSCKKTCPDYNGNSITHEHCKGKIYNCNYCAGSANNHKNTYQVYSTTKDRYYTAYYTWAEWNGQNVDHLSTRWDSWIYRYIRGFVVCDACLCTCDATGDSYSHRIFYTGLIEVKTAGHVITGVRFVKKENAIFIQIQTGQLLPLGMIAPETIAWQALPALGNTYTFVDFNQHQLALPDLTLPKKFALTGVQILKFGNNDISISIKGKSFNYLSGVLNTATVSNSYTSVSYSKSVENTIPLINSAVATYTIESNVRVYMGKGSEKKDAGQSYLPFFDSQNIELTIPAPLSGLQLIYYNTPEYGGFIRPRISSINYLDYLLTTANYTTAEEYDGDSKKINGRSGDWSEINLPLQSSAKVWTVMMPVIFISSIFSFYSRKYI